MRVGKLAKIIKNISNEIDFAFVRDFTKTLNKGHVT